MSTYSYGEMGDKAAELGRMCRDMARLEAELHEYQEADAEISRLRRQMAALDAQIDALVAYMASQETTPGTSQPYPPPYTPTP